MRLANIQFSAFGRAQPKGEEVFRALAGTDPTTTNSNLTAQGYTSSALGPLPDQERLLLVNLQPGRIDVILTPFDPAAAQPPLFPDDWKVFDSFAARVGTIATMIAPAARLSAVLTGQEYVQSGDEAFNAVLKASRLPLDRAGGSDAVVQINRRRPSASLESVQINRVVKWMSGSSRLVALSADGLTAAPEMHFVSFQADVNTHPGDSIEFRSEQISSIWDELYIEAKRIIVAGSFEALQN